MDDLGCKNCCKYWFLRDNWIFLDGFGSINGVEGWIWIGMYFYGWFWINCVYWFCYFGIEGDVEMFWIIFVGGGYVSDSVLLLC